MKPHLSKSLKLASFSSLTLANESGCLFINSSTDGCPADGNRHLGALLGLLHAALSGSYRLYLANALAIATHQMLANVNPATEYLDTDHGRSRAAEDVVDENLNSAGEDQGFALFLFELSSALLAPLG